MVRLATPPLVLLFVLGSPLTVPAPGAVTRAEVERAIKDGVLYLTKQQRADGSWREADSETLFGTTCLVVLALLAAGEPADSPAISGALEYLRGFGPDRLKSV